MESLREFGYQETDLEFGDVLSDMLKGKDIDELTELLCECETLLQTNDIYLTKLNAKGLKRLFHLITGIEKKCKKSIQDNFQLMHRITLNVEKVILQRFTDFEKLIATLNDKLERDNQFTQYCIHSLLQKVNDHKKSIEGLQREVRLLTWEKLDLENYISYKKKKKVLQIVSDLYAITGGSCRIGFEWPKLALKELEVSETLIPLDIFAEEILHDATCLPLYIKNELDYNTFRDKLSEYGTVICQANTLVVDQNIQELCEAKNETMETLCLPLLKKKIETRNMDSKSAKDICMQLLEDLKTLHAIASEERLQVQKSLEDERKLQESLQKQKQIEENQKYPILRMTPEKLHLYEDKGEIIKLDQKEPYTFKDEAMLESYLENTDPYLVAAPIGFKEHAKKVKNLLENRFVALSDYYMYLWFHNMNLEMRAKRKLAFIEYYATTIYVSVYGVDSTGSKYEKGGQMEIGHGTAIDTMHKRILGHEYFKDVSDKNEIIVFQTFLSDLQGLPKLVNVHKVQMVDWTWQNKLHESVFRKNMKEALLEGN